MNRLSVRSTPSGTWSAGRTGWPDGARMATWRACSTDGCSQVHQSLVELPGGVTVNGQQGLHQVPDTSCRCRARIEAREKHATHHPFRVRVDSRGTPAVREGRYRARGIRTYSGKPFQGVRLRGQHSVVLLHDDPRESVQILGSAVVAQTVPGLANLAGRRTRERLDRRIPSQKPRIVVLNPRDLRLLQHELGHEDLVRVAGAAPRKIASHFPVPLQQSALEGEGTSGRADGHGSRCGW